MSIPLKQQRRAATGAGRMSLTAAGSPVLTLILALGLAASPAGATESEPAPAAAPALDPTPGEPDDAAGTTDWGDVTRAEAVDALDGTGSWTAADDLGSMHSVAAATGAHAAWRAGITGAGVTVAVIDTGIAPVAGLRAAGQVLNGPDLSFDSQHEGRRHLDGYGHGTHMAGIIAGRDDQLDPQHPDATGFAGIAPDAGLLDLKVGAADGGADVSQVIAALDWVSAHRRDRGMDVRVVNLAYGTASVQPWQVDPLARAVENAWEAGIVVVAAAGNDGLAEPLLMPAVDPHVLAVGAVDHAGTANTADDVVAEFTNGGTSARRPDVLAPGKSVVSLRVPGSFVDTDHPEGRVRGDDEDRFFRGSGTSQATAVAAGEIALLLQARPELTPDQVKALLVATADPLAQNPHPAMGAGVVDLAQALQAAVPAGDDSASLPSSSGTGSLDASRGGAHVVSPVTGEVLDGEVDALGSPWDGAGWAAASSAGTAWSGGAWNGAIWTGEQFVGDDWEAAEWTGSSWTGLDWPEHVAASGAWEASTWRGDHWEASTWRESDWEASTWRARTWRASTWRQESWLARTWRSLS